MQKLLTRPQFKCRALWLAAPEQSARTRERARICDRKNVLDSDDLAVLRQKNTSIGCHGSPAQWSPVGFITTPIGTIIPEAPARWTFSPCDVDGTVNRLWKSGRAEPRKLWFSLLPENPTSPAFTSCEVSARRPASCWARCGQIVTAPPQYRLLARGTAS
jgi:hypothetical protein